MPLYKTNLDALNKAKPIELELEINSFAGGENTVGEDQALKTNEARRIENWDSDSLGGMIRSKGLKNVADGNPDYSDALDLLIQHIELTSTRVYGIIAGDLVYKNGAVISQADAGAFTAGVLSHGVSKADKLWITNSTDNLKYKTLVGAITIPASIPPYACDRVYYHKSRLVAEGGRKTVYGCRAGTGYWLGADAWSATNDAWSIDLPDNTKGCGIGFPSGDYITVFTKYRAYALSNFPSVAQTPILGSHGCSAPYSIAIGNEGLYMVSEYPDKGVWLWDSTQWINLTLNHDFKDEINFANRIFGAYRNQRYYLLYNAINSGASYPNKLRIYDAKFGRWMSRPINVALSDSLGYPALLTYDNNELYFGSSQKSKMYELEIEDNSDDGENTIATYTTKNFSSRDFSLGTGGEFTIDDVRMKLIKLSIVFYGTVGSISIQWSADNGRITGSQTIDLTASGDKLNTTFVVNVSKVTTVPPDKEVTVSFKNTAVGRRFQFHITHSGSSTRPKVKRIKIHAIALEEM